MVAPVILNQAINRVIEELDDIIIQIAARICEAVSNFFMFLVHLIEIIDEDIAGTSFESLTDWPDCSEKVKGKLAPYAYMPNDPLEFMRQAVENLREELARLDEPEDLETFNENLASLSATEEVMKACVRAALFSRNNVAPHFIRGRNEKVNDEPFYLFGSRHVPQINIYRNKLNEILAQKRIFIRLSSLEKETIIDKFSPQDISQVVNSDGSPLSEEGKNILRFIAATTQFLIQHNEKFDQTLQALC